MIILLIVLLVFFGPKRLPEMGRSLGRGMREFKDSISGKDDDDEPVHRRYSSELPRGEAESPEYVDDEPRQNDPVSRDPISQNPGPRERDSSVS